MTSPNAVSPRANADFRDYATVFVAFFIAAAILIVIFGAPVALPYLPSYLGGGR